MEQIYARLRERAHQIVSRFPPPEFYTTFSHEADLSERLLKTDPLIRVVHEFVEDHLEDDFGHGMRHAIKVTRDAGTLMFIEGHKAGFSGFFMERCVILVQCAGLLHDIKRKQKNHALLGAGFAREVLEDFAISTDEIDAICTAIQNHEAFKKPLNIETAHGALISHCLYDADKFRWGPDNFKDTLWDMVSFYKPTLADFVKRYPKGMEGIARIKDTFRTATGKMHGPRFIDLGLAIGEELFDVIAKEFGPEK